MPSLRSQVRKGHLLDLSDQGLEALPEELFELTDLKKLKLSKNRLTELPEAIGALTALEALVLDDNQLTALPDALGDLPKLQLLDLRHNKLQELPQGLNRAPALQKLLLSSNRFKEVPELFWHVGTLKDFDGVKGYARGNPKHDFQRFYADMHKANRTPDARARVFQIWTLGPRLGDCTLPQLFEALTIPNDKVRKNAAAAILKRTAAPLAEQPLAEGSTLAFLGNTRLKKTEVKETLTANGIGYASRLNDAVTHVVVGPNPTGWETIDAKPRVFLTEVQLSDELDRIADRFLLDEQPEVAEDRQNVAELLASPDEDNVAVGLELLKTGGVPEELFTELFLVSRCSASAKNRKAARDLLTLHGTPAVRKAASDRTKLWSSGHKGERKTTEALAHYKHMAPSIQWNRVALLLYEREKTGLQFVLLTNPSGHPDRQVALDLLTQGGHLDLRTLGGHYPDYNNTYAYYNEENFPIEATGMPLTSIDARGCRLGSLPPEIGRLTGLQVLDLRGNMLRRLPDEITALTSLQKLLLGDNTFTAVPPQLAKMPWLKELDFTGNRHPDGPRHRPHVHALGDEVRAALPDTAITDGYSGRQEDLERYYWNT
ncbi:MAG: leucine-rich repeat domain-containing protein [Alphaproteobacteria bacterium]|nr:leucine-rich repeat domain-containing protein [Alphaproteobacteria bacterium]